MRKYLALSIIAAATLCVGSCGGDNSRKEAARNLVEQARSLTVSHQYDSALTVLDTLNIKYRDCLEQRKEGTLVRLEALSALTRDSIAAAELQLRGVSAVVDSLAPLFKKVDLEGTDGYYVDKDIFTGNEMNTTGIEARVDDKGYCFVIANVSGKRIGLNSIVFGDTSTPPTPSIEVEGSEIMSVTQEAAAPLLDALSNTTGKAVITLSGPKGKATATLSAKQIKAIADTWEYARAVQNSRLLNIRLEKLERQLAKLSDQLASQTPVEEEK